MVCEIEARFRYQVFESQCRIEGESLLKLLDSKGSHIVEAYHLSEVEISPRPSFDVWEGLHPVEGLLNREEGHLQIMHDVRGLIYLEHGKAGVRSIEGCYSWVDYHVMVSLRSHEANYLVFLGLCQAFIKVGSIIEDRAVVVADVSEMLMA